MQAFYFKRVLLFLILIAQIAQSHAQDSSSTAKVKQFIGRANTQHRKLWHEKVFLQTDKPYYTAGDTLWFKAWLMNNATNTASASIKLYVDVIADNNTLVNTMIIPVEAGLGQGDIKLDNGLASGTYTLRAYTNWMQNFGESSFFNKRFFVGNPSPANNWLITEQHIAKRIPEGMQVDLNMLVQSTDKTAVPYHDIELTLVGNNKKGLMKTLSTAGDGTVKTSFLLPADIKTDGMTLIITDKSQKDAMPLRIPFFPEKDIDLQFLPEGGSLISGLYNRVAFKALASDGLAVAITGKVFNSKNEEVANLGPQHDGMGSFILWPQPNENYVAKIIAAGYADKSIALPKALNSGLAMRIDNTSNPDSILIRINASADVTSAKKEMMLIAQSQDMVHFGTVADLSRGFLNLRLSKKLFPTGIISFILIDADRKPLNERRVFIYHPDRLIVDVKNSRDTYQPRDSVAIQLNVRDSKNNPLMGNFTVAVTDDTAIKIGKYNDNLLTRMLMTSELKGIVENPGWYFANNNTDTQKALDDLMLTQGWTAYKSVLTDTLAKLKFELEENNHISGVLLGFLNKPLKNASVKLLSSSKKYGIIMLDTTTNDQGFFDFRNLPLTDTIAYALKAQNSKGGQIGATIKLNEIALPKATLTADYRDQPWFTRGNDSLMIKYFNRPNQPVLQGMSAGDVKGRLLNEVVVKSKRAAVRLPNDIGSIKVDITEKELIAARKQSLLDLLKERITGFSEVAYYSMDVFKRPGRHYLPQYCIGQIYISDVIIDDQSVQRNYGSDVTHDSTTYHNYLKALFNDLGADDITSLRYIGGTNRYLTISTRGHQGVIARSTPGTGVYRPLPMYFPREFYRPKYKAKTNTQLPDLRSTIHWEPNVVTDSAGRATVSFYAADKPSTYTVIIQGTDMEGHYGYKTTSITILPKAGNDKSISNR